MPRKPPAANHPWKRGLVPVVPETKIVVNSGLVDPEFDEYSLDDIEDFVKNQQEGGEI